MFPGDLGNGSRLSESTYPVVVGVDGSFTAIRRPLGCRRR
jgi:hypothetical protein